MKHILLFLITFLSVQTFAQVSQIPNQDGSVSTRVKGKSNADIGITITNITWTIGSNLASTPAASQLFCTKLGKLVYCEGTMVAQATAASEWTATFPYSSLPFAPREGVAGTGLRTGTSAEKAVISGAVTANILLRAYGNATTANNTWRFNFTYLTI